MGKTEQVNFNKLEWQRNQRKKDGNTYTNKYEKTKSGFLMRKYRNMEWITHSENSRLGALARHRREYVTA